MKRGKSFPNGQLEADWWRRGESNPRPKTLYSGLLRAFPVVWISSSRTPAGRVPFGPSRFGFRPSSPREGDSGYPVRATPFRLHGQSAVGRTRLVRPRKRSYSRWRLLVPAFNEVRGASARNPGASTSPSKPFRPLLCNVSFSAGWRNPAQGGRYPPRSRDFALPLVARSMSRFASRAAISSRLSYSFLPRASPIASFTCGPFR